MTLAKWDVIHLQPPGVGHGKFAVCVCATNKFFFYINSSPPPFRKAAAAAVELSPFNATFLSKRCFLDTAIILQPSDAVIDAALVDPKSCLGPLSPTVRQWVIAMVRQHAVLPPDQRNVVLLGEV